MKKNIKEAAEKIHDIMKNNGDKYWSYGRSYLPSVKKISSVIMWVMDEIKKDMNFNLKETNYNVVNIVTVNHSFKDEKHIWSIEYKNTPILTFEEI